MISNARERARIDAPDESSTGAVPPSEPRNLCALGALAAGMAHEINTPTQYIGDNLRFLLLAFERLVAVLPQPLPAAADAELDVVYYAAEIPAAIEQSIEGLAHIARMVGAVRRFATVPAGDDGPVDLNAEVESVLTLARNEWKYVAQVERDLDPDLPPVHGVGSDLQFLVLCLLLEAARGSAESEARHSACQGVTIRTRHDAEHVELIVNDPAGWSERGVEAGSPKPAQTGAERGARDGTRPDLVLASDIVRAHGGTLGVDATPQSGRTVIVRLPLRRHDALAGIA